MLLVESFIYQFRDAVVAEKWKPFLRFSVLWFLSWGFHRPVHRVWKVVNDLNLNLRPSLTTYGGFWPNVSDGVSSTIIKTPHEGMYFGRTALIPPRVSEDRCQHAMTSVRRHVEAEHRTRTLDVGFSFHLSLVCMFSTCAVVTYATSKPSSPCFTLYMSSNWISISFPKKLFQGPGLLCVRMWRTVLVFFGGFFCERHPSGEATQELAELLMLSAPRLVRFPLTALGCPSLTRRRKGPRRQTLEIVSDCQRERKQALFYSSLAQNVAPLTVRRISSARVMNSRRISRLTREDGGGRPTAATKTLSLTRGRRRSKTGGERRSRLPSHLLSKRRELYHSERVIRLQRTPSSE